MTRWRANALQPRELTKQPRGTFLAMGVARRFDMRSVATCVLLTLGACATGEGEDVIDLAVATVTTTTTPPADGQCAHIVATRMSDFQVSEYKGPPTGAALTVRTGEHRVTATAYATPCASEPVIAPWVATQQMVSFSAGSNSLALSFKRNALAEIVAEFVEDDTLPMALRPGTRIATGRNGEDSTGPDWSLNGWLVSQLALPPAAPSETVRLSMQGKGLPYTPRGMARLPSGNFVFQVGETFEPVWETDGAGNLVGARQVRYTGTRLPHDFADGLEAIDEDRLVGTVWFNAGQSGFETLTRRVELDGTVWFEVTDQVLFAEPLASSFVVSVAPVGSAFVVVALPPASSQLHLVDAAGTVLGSGPEIAGSFEGIVDDGARLLAVDYSGRVQAFERTPPFAPRAGETLTYPIGAGLSTPSLLAWRSQPGQEGYVVFTQSGRLAQANADFTSVADIAVDPAELVGVGGLDYLAGADEIAILRRTATARVRFFHAGDGTFSHDLVLAPGAPGSLRGRGLAFAGDQIVTHYRRPNAVVDASLDAMVFLHDFGGNLVGAFDLAPYGFTRVAMVNYLPATDELLVTAVDVGGITRLVATSRAGEPRRSYRIDPFPALTDLAPITSGAFVGVLGAVSAQPSELVRLILP
jgi:hypothetical protein